VTDPKSTTRMPGADQRIYEARLLRVLLYIHDHLDGDLSLDAVAEVACMSPHHWHRVFRALTGETLADAIRRLRLLKAANALVSNDAPVADIAERFGYPNLASFSRAFSAQHGKPPGAFRDESQERAAALRQATGDHAMYPVIVRNLPACRAAGVSHIGPYEGLGLAFQKLGAVIAARSLVSQIEALIAVYHDAPGSKPDRDLHAHAAVITTSGFPSDIEGLDYFDLVGGRHAIMQHHGPYATLGSAYEWLYGKWLPQSGEEPQNAPPIELYVNDPRITPPDQLRTDVRLPLA
jgi:AraC family transcriptional regulator